MIRRDIARTYPEHDLFKKKDGVGQESLFNVMKAYSVHDREVGYCQGSAFIVGLLLMQVKQNNSWEIFSVRVIGLHIISLEINVYFAFGIFCYKYCHVQIFF